MDQLRISAREAKTKPNYRTHAAELLNWCREFYQDPENERAYQEWKARKEGQHEKTAV